MQDRISPRRGDTGLGVQMSPIHRWNEPDRAQLLWDLAKGMRGTKVTAPTNARMCLSSL